MNVPLSHSLCLFSEFVFQIFGFKKRESSGLETRKKKMSSMKFVTIVLQMIVIEHLFEVNYCNSFNHTAGNREPFGRGLFIKFTFISSGKLNSIFFYSILSFLIRLFSSISCVCVCTGFSAIGYPQDLLQQGELFKKTTLEPKSYSIAFKYHANSFSGPPFFVQLNVNGAEVSCISFSVLRVFRKIVLKCRNS